MSHCKVTRQTSPAWIERQDRVYSLLLKILEETRALVAFQCLRADSYKPESRSLAITFTTTTRCFQHWFTQ